MRNAAIALVITTALSACSLAPDFNMPEVKAPEAFKEAPKAAPTEQEKSARTRWKEAENLEAAARGEWWKTFGDPELDKLEQLAIENNASLQAAAKRIEQSRATAEASTFSFLPDLGISGNASRSKPSNAAAAGFGIRNANLKPYNLYSARGVLSYEADLFGRVRDGYSALLMDALGSEADFQNALLALQADVASNYFSIRALDSEIALLRDTVAIRDKAHDIMKHKYDAGAAGEQDLTRTMSELAATRAELTGLERQRSVLEHSLAVLLGKMPSEFSMKPAALVGVPPQVPAGLPSTLLQRRPDITRATAAMQAANARIGVARTAFFPIISLTAGGGYESTEMDTLFQWGSRFWALGQVGGAAITMPIFDSGRNLSRLDSAKAAYAESVENYRQQVLVAFRDVEDNLTNQRMMAVQSRQLDDAAAAASRTTEVIQTRYDEGAVDFFEVVNAQRDSLAASRASVQMRGQRFLNGIALIRALGGGWNVPEAAPIPPEADTPAPEAAAPEPKKEEAPKPAEKPVKKAPAKAVKSPAKKPAASKAKTAEPPAAPPAPVPTASEKLFTPEAVDIPVGEPIAPSRNRRGPAFGTQLNK